METRKFKIGGRKVLDSAVLSTGIIELEGSVNFNSRGWYASAKMADQRPWFRNYWRANSLAEANDLISGAFGQYSTIGAE